MSKISNIREKMLFSHEWHLACKDTGNYITCRLYWTKGGTYGPQAQAIIWRSGDRPVVCGSRTTGCGYSKDGAAVASALQAAGFGVDSAPYKLADSGSVSDAIFCALHGREPSNMDERYSVHHAHA